MTAPFSLAGRIALVTGAAGGIGGGIAEVLAEAGALTVIADIDAEAAAAKSAELQDRGWSAASVGLDVANEQSVIAACSVIVAEHGVPWVVVNNAGIQNRQYLDDETVEGWDRIQAVNARGPFLVTREMARAMRQAGVGGRFVNIASATLSGMLVKGAGAYVASKGALAAFSSAAALEYAGDGITVNTVLPGAVLKPGSMGAKGPPTEGPGTRRAVFGLCEPRDIGYAALYFASPAARMVTNQVLSVDGGFTIS